MSELLKVLGDTVRRIREGHGLPQQALAAAAGISHKTLVSIEKGHKPTKVDVIERLAKQLGVEPWELLGGPAQAIGAKAPEVPKPVREATLLEDTWVARVAKLKQPQRDALEPALQNAEEMEIDGKDSKVK